MVEKGPKISGKALPPFRAMPKRKHFFCRRCSLTLTLRTQRQSHCFKFISIYPASLICFWPVTPFPLQVPLWIVFVLSTASAVLAQSCCKNRPVNTWAWKEPLCIYPNMCARKINTQSLESSARKRFGLASGQWSASLPYPSPFRPCPLDVVKLSITSPFWP